jgi:hypothetical protein
VKSGRVAKGKRHFHDDVKDARLKGRRPLQVQNLESAAHGQKKLPKELSFGSYAYPHMVKPSFGGALLQAQLSQLNAERAAAAARTLDVRVIEFEARTFDCLDVVNLDTVKIHLAHLVDENLEAVEFIDVVAVLIDLVFESHVIAETRATAAHDGNAQAGRRGILLRQDFLHFGNGYWC